MLNMQAGPCLSCVVCVMWQTS